MKKPIILLAATVALGAAGAIQAETTLYGSARVSVDYVDDEANDDPFWQVTNNGSRLGVQGSEDLGGGLSAIYQYEFRVDVTGNRNYFESNGPRFVGLKGGFGAVTLGTQFTPYYNVIGINDLLYSARTFDVDIYLYPEASPREGNSFIYETPNFGGFSAQGMVVADGINNKDGVDRWNLNAKYQNGPFTVGGAYARFRDGEVDDDTYLWGLGLGYTGERFSVIFTHENGDASDVYGKARSYLLGGAYNFGNNSIVAQYGLIDPRDFDDADKVHYYTVGFWHNLSKRSTLWAEYIGRNDKDEIAGGDRNAVSIGMKHDF